MKRFCKLTALLCCLSLLLSLGLVGCAPNEPMDPLPTDTTDASDQLTDSSNQITNGSDYQFTMFDEAAPNYTLTYTANGDGTCYVSDIQTNLLAKQDFTLTVPEQSPAGDTVTEIRLTPKTDADGNALHPLASIFPPRYLRKESFEKLVATMEANLQKAIDNGNISEQQARFELTRFKACYMLIDINDPDMFPDVKEQYLTKYPNLEMIESFYVLDYSSMGNNTHIKLQNILLTYSDYSAENYAREIEEIAALAKENEKAEAWVEDTLLAYAYRSTNRITSLVLPDTVTKVQSGDFGSCTNLQTVKLPNVETPCRVIDHTFLISTDETVLFGTILSETYIHSTYMYKNAKIPNSVTALSETVFSFSSRWEFIIPITVTDIGNFAGTVYYEGTETQWESVRNNEACTVYYYSETPALGCWYYRSNATSPTLWTEADLTA